MKKKWQWQISRGDIYYVDLDPIVGSEQGGIRPVINIQNEVGNRHSPTIIVAAITTKPKAEMPTHVSIDMEGLEMGSVILLEQLRTIDKKRLREYVGTAGMLCMKKVDEALGVSLEIKLKADPLLIPLCSICARQFYDAEEYYIKRADMEQREKDTCMICNVRRGYDFLIDRRR